MTFRKPPAITNTGHRWDRPQIQATQAAFAGATGFTKFKLETSWMAAMHSSAWEEFMDFMVGLALLEYNPIMCGVMMYNVNIWYEYIMWKHGVNIWRNHFWWNLANNHVIFSGIPEKMRTKAMFFPAQSGWECVGWSLGYESLLLFCCQKVLYERGCVVSGRCSFFPFNI